MNSLAVTLGSIGTTRLDTLSAKGLVGKVVRRVVDREAETPKLDVAAFNSAI
jgi:FXSXX-COOH protein